MLGILSLNPWLILCGMIALTIVLCVAIVFVSDYLRKTHQAEIDAALKQDMLSRGMSAEEIRTVLEASSDGAIERLMLEKTAGVRVGLGKFQIEVGNPAKSTASS